MLYVYETVPVRVLDPRFQIRREISDLFIINIYISHLKIMYNHVSDVDIPTKQFAPIRRLMVHFLFHTAGALSVLPVQCRN